MDSIFYEWSLILGYLPNLSSPLHQTVVDTINNQYLHINLRG